MATEVNTAPIDNPAPNETSPSVFSKVAQFIPGTYLDVEASHPKGTRFRTQLLGVDPGQYLIFKMPDTSKVPFLKEAMLETNPLVVRFLAEDNSGEILAFRCAIKWVVGYPVKMIFASFPEKIESRQLRSESRAITRVPAKIFSEIESANDDGELVEVSVPGVIVDISKTGCRFTFNAPKSTTGVKSKEIQVQLSLEGQNEPLVLSGEICNQKKNESTFSLGIKFVDIPPQFEEQIKTLLL
jgi:c-di-GMP-binding flagellar brake protein YcgR